jgi:hypothetical protein
MTSKKEGLEASQGISPPSVAQEALTPGDWYIVTCNGSVSIKGPGAVLLARIYHPPAGSALANARLIAAAPELLEALRACHKWLPAAADHPSADSTVYDALEAADAAIAKAIGHV